MTIRCFRKEDMFIQENVNRVNSSLRMDFHNNASNEWLGFRLELIGSLLLCASTLFMILLPASIIKPGCLSFPALIRLFHFHSPLLVLVIWLRELIFYFLLYGSENVGLSLSYGLSLNGTLFWAIYMSCFVENRMVSVERIKQFTEIPSEAAWTIKDRHPPPNWPSQGNVEIKDLQVRKWLPL